MKDGKKLKGKPEMTSGKRTKKIDARFTEAEYELIVAMEKELGISKTEIVRSRVLQNGKQLVINAVSLITKLDEIGAELGRSGSNINQLARYANILKKNEVLSVVVIERFNLLMENYNRQQLSMTVALRQIIRNISG